MGAEEASAEVVESTTSGLFRSEAHSPSRWLTDYEPERPSFVSVPVTQIEFRFGEHPLDRRASKFGADLGPRLLPDREVHLEVRDFEVNFVPYPRVEPHLDAVVVGVVDRLEDARVLDEVYPDEEPVLGTEPGAHLA